MVYIFLPKTSEDWNHQTIPGNLRALRFCGIFYNDKMCLPGNTFLPLYRDFSYSICVTRRACRHCELIPLRMRYSDFWSSAASRATWSPLEIFHLGALPAHPIQNWKMYFLAYVLKFYATAVRCECCQDEKSKRNNLCVEKLGASDVSGGEGAPS